ncbi:alpha/beta hydrolase [Caulobacter vibrioides]|nr:alpha/beta hydrolase [Caulobacter vibrioides]PLR14573.1 alpha/beta hydrolase [Caulobacter vibrioides]
MQPDGYTFALSPDVSRTPVRYRNRYGIEIAGDLYRSKSFNSAHKHSALVVGPPHGGIKEQGGGIYAQEMAKRGFVALAFDPSYNGESGGSPRNITSPELFAEDFSAGVDFLGTLPEVARDRIGAIGICGSGGFLLSQAAVDIRIRAVATTSMYDISRMLRNGWEDSATEADRRGTLNSLAAQRWADVDHGRPQLQPTFPDKMPSGGLDPITQEFFDYYVADRGRHPRSIGGFTLTSGMSHINFGQLRHIADIAPRRILLVTGDQAHSRFFTETVHKQAPQHSELVVVSGARHIDLYDRVDLIPFDKFTAFFKEQLS